MLDSMAAISRRQRAIHTLAFLSAATSSNARPSPSSLAFLPLSVSHRWTITSTYLASNSRPRQMRSVSSAAASVRAASQERIENRLATLQVVQNRASHQIDGFLGRMIKFAFV
jgi:hypothetical protein